MVGERFIRKKVNSQQMTKRAHFSQCINLPTRKQKKESESAGLNEGKGWDGERGEKAGCEKNAPLGSPIEKASSLLLGPVRLLSPLSQCKAGGGPQRPPAP